MRYSPIHVALTMLLLVGGSGLAFPDRAMAQSEAAPRFSDYPPGRCAVAARVIDGINRHDRRDTSIHSPERDTLFTATRERIRECEAVYEGQPPEAVERLNVARVQLLTGQDEAALATAREHMESMAGRPIPEQAWELYLIFNDHLAARPARLERAKQILVELDAMGDDAGSVRVLAHYAMMNAAIQHHDFALMREEMAGIVDAWQGLDEETRSWRYFWFYTPMINRVAVEALVEGREAALVLLDSARGLIPSSDTRTRNRLRGLEQMYRLIGESAAPLDAQFWYNTGQTGATRPAPGRVSLVLPLARPCSERSGCLPMMDAARRIQETFRDEDLDITFRTRTWGFYADTAPAPPIAEAQYDSAYFLHDVEIPGALAIAETQYSFRPDGRRSNEPTRDDLNYRGAQVVVIDRQGIIRYVAERWNPVFEALVTELIAELLNDGVPTSVP